MAHVGEGPRGVGCWAELTTRNERCRGCEYLLHVLVSAECEARANLGCDV